MYNNFFGWNYDHLVLMLLPPNLRNPKVVGFIGALTSGLNDVQNTLNSFRVDAKYQALFSGERLQFEHYLNDEFDRIGRSIKIINSPFLEKVYLYKDIENRPLRIYKYSENKPRPRLYKHEEYAVSIHFIIQIPTSLNLSDVQVKRLRVWVDQRKLPNKNYIIQNI